MYATQFPVHTVTVTSDFVFFLHHLNITEHSAIQCVKVWCWTVPISPDEVMIPEISEKCVMLCKFSFDLNSMIWQHFKDNSFRRAQPVPPRRPSVWPRLQLINPHTLHSIFNITASSALQSFSLKKKKEKPVTNLHLLRTSVHWKHVEVTEHTPPNFTVFLKWPHYQPIGKLSMTALSESVLVSIMWLSGQNLCSDSHNVLTKTDSLSQSFVLTKPSFLTFSFFLLSLKVPGDFNN